ncbi:MAG: antibiotic biosynthesis monooxygenase [Pseudodesulfovibrio sp.]
MPSWNHLFELYEIDGEENHFVVYEYWKDMAALENHFNQPYSHEMGALLTKAVPGPLFTSLAKVR